MGEGRRSLRLMCDYHAEWPLWLDGGGNPEDLPLTESLVVDLKGWQGHFDAHYHFDRGWETVEHQSWHEAQGRVLRRRLEAEIGRFFTVELVE